MTTFKHIAISAAALAFLAGVPAIVEWLIP